LEGAKEFILFFFAIDVEELLIIPIPEKVTELVG